MSKPLSDSVTEEFQGILAFVGAIWAVSLASFFLPWLKGLGLVPRSLSGLIGIPMMPFLHGSLGHLISNTIPLIVLLTLLAGSKAKSWEIVASIIGLNGLLLWLVGRTAVHVGASGLVFGLATFLMLSGFLERRIIPMIIAVVVALMYGMSLVFGMVPRFGSSVSWDGHICGAIAGGVVAYLLVNGNKLGNSGSVSDRSLIDV